MAESCPSDKCKVQNVCSEIHKLGYGDDPAWLAIVLIVRNLLAKFSCFSESQKSLLKSYVFYELKKKDNPDLAGGHKYIDSPRHTNYIEVDTYLNYLATLRDRFDWPEVDESTYETLTR